MTFENIITKLLGCPRLRDSRVRGIEKARTFSFFPPCPFFASLSLSLLPHYLRTWNRLPNVCGPNWVFQSPPYHKTQNWKEKKGYQDSTWKHFIHVSRSFIYSRTVPQIYRPETHAMYSWLFLSSLNPLCNVLNSQQSVAFILGVHFPLGK